MSKLATTHQSQLCNASLKTANTKFGLSLNGKKWHSRRVISHNATFTEFCFVEWSEEAFNIKGYEFILESDNLSQI